MATATSTTPDLLGITLADRTMRRDLHRLTAAAEQIADGRPCPPARAAAIGAWVRDLRTEIHHHHTAEDDVARPVIAEHAGAAVDLTALSGRPRRARPASLLLTPGAAPPPRPRAAPPSGKIGRASCRERV